MNSNYNNIFQKLIPYIYAVLFAYIITSIIFVFLPKAGIDFKNSSKASIVYQKYDGFYSKVSVIKTAKVNKVKNKVIESLTRYTLKGIYATSSKGGWIIIEDKSSKKSTILEQYEKFNGYTLTKIYKKYVIFEKNLKEYKLELPKEKELSYKIERTTETGNENVIVKDDSVTVKRNYLNSYVNDINKVWQNIAINEIRKDGKIEGFKIQSVNTKSVFGKLGLKQNDIIKSVNGTQLKSYADAFKVYNTINRLEYLTLEVLRNNEIVELNYEID